jgi:hypothetical protein
MGLVYLREDTLACFKCSSMVIIRDSWKFLPTFRGYLSFEILGSTSVIPTFRAFIKLTIRVVVVVLSSNEGLLYILCSRYCMYFFIHGCLGAGSRFSSKIYSIADSKLRDLD